LGLRDVALTLLLGYDCFLSTGEMFTLTPEDLSLVSGRIVVRLGATKGGVRRGLQEALVVRSAWISAYVAEALPSLKPGRRLCGRTAAELRAILKELCAIFGLDRYRITWYSIRSGGATAYFISTDSMEKTLLRGRWASSATARFYIQDAVADIVGLSLSGAQKELLSQAKPLLA
jgi:hypothetical protein